MKIYIASSWKNQHAVEMMTNLLRSNGHEIISFVEKAINDEGRDLKFDINEWIWSKDGNEKFWYDIDGATKSDLVIYIGPSGIDAWAEVGAAFASNIPIFGLWSKGEQSGLMRRMISWYTDYKKLLEAVESHRHWIESRMNFIVDPKCKCKCPEGALLMNKHSENCPLFKKIQDGE